MTPDSLLDNALLASILLTLASTSGCLLPSPVVDPDPGFVEPAEAPAQAEPDAFAVLSATPANGAEEVAVDAEIVIRFNAPLPPGAAASLELVAEGAWIAGDTWVVGDALHYRPTNPLPGNTLIEGWIRGIESADGETLQGDFYWSFETELGPAERFLGGTHDLEVDEWRWFGPLHVAEGALTVNTTGSGDVDVYVRRGERPDAEAHDCASYGQDAQESCRVDGPGAWYVALHGYTATSASVEMMWTGDLDLVIEATVGRDEWHLPFVLVHPGEEITATTESRSDVDLYAGFGRYPGEDDHDAVSAGPDGSETIRLTAEEEIPLALGVYGYRDGTYTLRITAD